MTQPHPVHFSQIDDLVSIGTAIYNRAQALRQEAHDLEVTYNNVVLGIEKALSTLPSDQP
jgi:hypothetical protein